MAVTVLTGASTTGARRIRRSPKHSWHLRQRPWQIQPCAIAPVLAGESLVSLQWQARVVSDPIKNPLIGWHCEHLFFYVKLSDLERDTVDEQKVTNMLIDPNYDIVAQLGAAAAKTSNYHHAGTVDWSARCLEAIVDHYFRNEGEDPTATGFHIDNVQLASTGTEGSWLDSVAPSTVLDAIDVNVDTIDGNGADNIMMSDIEAARIKWTLARQQGLTKMTFEDYLRSFGVGPAPSEIGKPELIRFNREWSYPSNTVEPTTGVPSSALSWSVSARADKRRLFTEPGFIFGVSIIRPKVYRQNQSGSFVDSLTSALRWLPAWLSDDPSISIARIDNALSGPLTGQTNDYDVDFKDLFLYGDQFLNFSLASTDANIIGLPSAAGLSRYASSADADELFVDTTTPKNMIRQDGVCQLQILGRQTDTTPTNRIAGRR